MARKVLGAGTSQAVSADQIKLKALVLTAAAADATAVITGNAGGNETVYLNAKAGTSAYRALPGDPEYGISLSGPVVATVAGTGAQLELDF